MEEGNTEEATREVKIKKATLKDGNIEIDYDEIINHPGPVINSFKMKGGNRPHDDLINAFAPLSRHIAAICEQVPVTAYTVSTEVKGKMKDITAAIDGSSEIVRSIKTTAFVISGDDENEGATLIGQRTVKVGTLNLISPFTKWESEYAHAEELYQDLNVAITECLAYLEGKHAPKEQLEMDFNEGGEGEPGMRKAS